MKRLLELPPRWAAVLYVVVDGVCVGMGMGVPFFNILLGFPVGAYLGLRVAGGQPVTPAILRRVLQLAALASLLTMVFLVILWAPFTRFLFDAQADLAQTGIPMILYDPRASFIGWQVLMMFISPFLQLLTSVLAAALVLAAPSNQRV